MATSVLTTTTPVHGVHSSPDLVTSLPNRSSPYVTYGKGNSTTVACIVFPLCRYVLVDGILIKVDRGVSVS
jgi:hypothetical protein